MQMPREERALVTKSDSVVGVKESDKGVNGLGERTGGGNGKRLRQRGWYWVSWKYC